MATTVTNLYARPRDKWGRYVTGASPVSAPRIKDEKRRRAKRWKKFREDYLFSQEHLATMLNCSRRTVAAVESAAVIPSLRIQRAFRDLVRQQKREAAA